MVLFSRIAFRVVVQFRKIDSTRFVTEFSTFTVSLVLFHYIPWFNVFPILSWDSEQKLFVKENTNSKQTAKPTLHFLREFKKARHHFSPTHLHSWCCADFSYWFSSMMNTTLHRYSAHRPLAVFESRRSSLPSLELLSPDEDEPLPRRSTTLRWGCQTPSNSWWSTHRNTTIRS